MWHFLVYKAYNKLDIAVTVILLEVLYVRITVLERLKFLLKQRFIVSNRLVWGNLSYCDFSIIDCIISLNYETSFIVSSYFTLKILPTYRNFSRSLVDSTSYQLYNILYSMRINCRTPSCSYTFRSIDQYQWQNGKIKFWLDYLILLLLVFYYMVICLYK